MGLLMEQQFIPLDKLSETEKADAQKLAVEAYQHWGLVVPIDDEASSLMAGSQQLANALYPSKLTMLESPNGSNFEAPDMFALHGQTQQDNYSTDVASLGCKNTLDGFGLLGFENLDGTSNQPLCFQGEINNSSIFDPESVRQDINDDPYGLFPSNPVITVKEVESAPRKYLTNMTWNIPKEIKSSESRSLQLQFLHKISLPIFTGSQIEGEDCNTLTVALVDALSGQVVYSGPESSARVEIVVLEGDLDGDEGGSWTLEEFKNNIVRERDGKKPLLTGDAFLILEEGIGLVGDISFTDNSSWTRSRKFRLGVRVVDNFDGVRVREAKTESFIVRDHRGECKCFQCFLYFW